MDANRAGLSFGQCHALVAAQVGHAILIRGEMGIGKSSLFRAVAADLPQHEPVFVDCTVIADASEFFLPRPARLNGMEVMDFVPTARLGLHTGKPLLLMFDELGKARPDVLNAALPCLLEHRLGRHHFPVGSLVLATTNLASEALGDRLPPHLLNRLSTVRMRKPTAAEFQAWGAAHCIDPVVLGFVEQYPACLADVDDAAGGDGNPYIHRPGRSVGEAFVTPRSLELASHLLRHADQLDAATLEAALAGTVGAAAAADLMALRAVRLPPMATILAKPLKAPLPDDGLAATLLVFAAAMRIDEATVVALCRYVQRLPGEHQSLFTRLVAARPAFVSRIGIEPSVMALLERHGELMSA